MSDEPAWKTREREEGTAFRYFVDEEIREYHGTEAARRLAQENDVRFRGESGIVQVDVERWQKAERYEERTWMEQNLHAADQRNHEHMREFDNYQALAGKKFPRVIELGCGHVTNLRLILPLIAGVETVELVDPLIDIYLTHPRCTYADLTLCGHAVLTTPAPAELLGAEQPGVYDLVVMVNVLEHCFDIPRIFSNVAAMLAPGGTLVFGDVCATQISAAEVYDAGHPLRMHQGFLNAWLAGNFTPLFHRAFRNDAHLRHRDLCTYYIGQKLPADANRTRMERPTAGQ